MRDAAIRAARTFAQAFVGVIVTSGVLQAAVDSGTVDISVWQTVGISALFAGVSAVLSFVQNLLEDKNEIVIGAK